VAVDATQAKVTRYRELAKVDPATYEPELGLALYALCMDLKNTAGPITTSTSTCWRKASHCTGGCSGAIQAPFLDWG